MSPDRVDPLQLVLLGLIIVNAAVLVVIVRLGRGRPSACGACARVLPDLEALACPHCEADLREAGILSPRMTRMPPAGLLVALGLVILSTLVPPAVLWSYGLVDQFNPPMTRSVQRLSYRGEVDSGSALGSVMDDATAGSRPVEITATIHALDSVASRCELEFEVAGVARGGTLVFEFEGGMPVRVDGDARSGATAADIERWLLGSDPERLPQSAEQANSSGARLPNIRRQALSSIAEALFDQITARAAGGGTAYSFPPLNSVAVNSSSDTVRMRPWVTWIFWLAWAVTWLAGAVLIVVWARRRLRHAEG